MFDDFKALLSAFNAHNVKYLIVGGYAVSLYAQPRATKDLDIWIKADTANAHACYLALASFGAPLDAIHESDFENPRKFIRFGAAPVAVDILPSIDGVDFDEAWERRQASLIDRTLSLRVFFISKEDLIAAKLAAGRLRDLADVEEIRQAEAERGSGPSQPD